VVRPSLAASLARRLVVPFLLLPLFVTIFVAAPALTGRDGAVARGALDAISTRRGSVVWVTPPRGGAATSPTRVTFLHGMCMDPQRTCDRVLALGDGHAALACPTGNSACGGGADWAGEGEDKAEHLDAALDAAWGHAGAADRGADVLIGFSRGAFVARDVAYARPGRFRALILIGAAMSPEASRLAASGIRRVVLASGDFDPARRTMERAARDLEAQGIPARFIRLGPVGHALPRDVAARLAQPIAWALEG
jgi:predicted esterase